MLFLLLTPVLETGNLFPNQMSMKYLNLRQIGFVTLGPLRRA